MSWDVPNAKASQVCGHQPVISQYKRPTLRDLATWIHKARPFRG